ncbi:serine/threonine-protein kinase [Streptomyces sp. NPDC006012]|uniref:serine/threonine-protein kinase n=1 Tax=Streptomyces sp. NPDC006012 TaxID=3364739 RepID=UPI00367BC137
MGEVWRARDETLGRDVAIKFLLAQGSDATATARFRLEAQTAGRLDHPHVVGVLDFGAQDDRLFLVMELVDGDSLARVLASAGSLPPERVARIAAEAAAGLAAAHQQGIVHRDIKPGNLLLAADGSLKIGDFGIARFMDDPAGGLTATGQIVGTSLYLAPERALGRNAGPPSDVYSLGCVLYQLLTGRPPFEADTAVAILHHHLDTAPTPPRQYGVDMPPALENYLLGMLAKQPEARPTAAQVAGWFGVDSWRGHREPLPPAEPGQSGRRAAGPGGPGQGTAAPTPQATARHTAAGPGGRAGAAGRTVGGPGNRAGGRTGGGPAGRTAGGPGSPARGGPAGQPGADAVGRADGGTTRHPSAEPGPATTYALPNSSAHSSLARRGRSRRPALRLLAARSPRMMGTIAAAVLFLAALLISMALFSAGSGSAETSGSDPSPSTGSTADSGAQGGLSEKQPEQKDNTQQYDDEPDNDDGDG